MITTSKRTFMAAKTIAELCNFKLSNLKMQKILFLSHMLYLGMAHKKLIDGNFEARDIGVIHKDVYDRFKFYGNMDIQNIFNVESFEESTLEYKSIKIVVDKTKNCKLSKLIALTQNKNGAWYNNYIPNVFNKIPDSDILDEYNFYKNKVVKAGT